MKPSQYLRKFTTEEFDRSLIGAETLSLRRVFAEATGQISYRPTAPYLLHTVHGEDEWFNASSYYGISGSFWPESQHGMIKVEMANGGYSEFFKRLWIGNAGKSGISAHFWLTAQEPGSVYMTAGDKFECYEASPQTPEQADSFLREMTQYMRRLQTGYIVNFKEDEADVWAATSNGDAYKSSWEKRHDTAWEDRAKYWTERADECFSSDLFAKGAISRMIAVKPGWPPVYKPSF